MWVVGLILVAWCHLEGHPGTVEEPNFLDCNPFVPTNLNDLEVKEFVYCCVKKIMNRNLPVGRSLFVPALIGSLPLNRYRCKCVGVATRSITFSQSGDIH